MVYGSAQRRGNRRTGMRDLMFQILEIGAVVFFLFALVMAIKERFGK